MIAYGQFSTWIYIHSYGSFLWTPCQNIVQHQNYTYASKKKKYSMTLRIHECIWFSDDDRVILETYDECQKLDCRQNYIRNSYVFKLDPSHWLGRHGSWDTNWDSQMENIQSVKEYSGPPCLQSGILKILKSLIMRVKFFLLF